MSKSLDFTFACWFSLLVGGTVGGSAAFRRCDHCLGAANLITTTAPFSVSGDSNWVFGCGFVLERVFCLVVGGVLFLRACVAELN